MDGSERFFCDARSGVLSAAQLSTLWQKHAAALLLLARSRCDSPEDCVQQAFIRLATQEPEPDCPLAWLATVVRNEALSHSREQNGRRRREKIAAYDRPRWFQLSHEILTDTPSVDELQNALLTLDDETREIVIAHVWTGMTFRQIAEAFDISRATAHRRYENGLQDLRRVMDAASDLK
ncbi:MAG TPA: sigma-70 family RNA polymerase sigma factor [Oceanospirillaceae bacterium]|nr:sigma-70 family RNA polymerase sigma factor [Oceanospirillaceae bacterium]